MTSAGLSAPQSSHFDVHQLAPGIFAAIARPGGGALSNAGIIDLGDRTLVFDALGTPQAARDLRRAAEWVGGRPVTWLINSHGHDDHFNGNQAFAPETTIVATSETARQIREEVEAFMAESSQDPAEVTAEYQEYVAGLRRQLDSEREPGQRRDLRRRIYSWEHIIASLPELAPRLPDFAFESRLTFHGRLRRAELITFGGGHTASDAFLVLPDDGIAFLADLLFVDNHPFLGSSDPENWLTILDQLSQLPVETMVPGHGPPGGQEDLTAIKAYIIALQKQVQEVIDVGGSADDAAARSIPPPFDAWSDGLFRYKRNVRFLFDRRANHGSAS